MQRATGRLIVALVAFIAVFALGSSRALGLSEAEIRKALEQNKQKQAELKNQSKRVTEALQANRAEQKRLGQEIRYLDLKMNEAETRLRKLHGEIARTEADVAKTEAALRDAEARIAARQAILKKRVRALYERGPVSYWEVLFGARSMGDFLSRLVLMGKVVAHDEALLEANRRDRALIAEKKAELDRLLADLRQKYAQVQAEKARLASLQKERTVQIAQLQAQAVDYEKELEKYDQQLSALVKEYNRLNQALTKVYWSGGQLAWPVPGYFAISSPFGYRIHPITRQRSFHSGIDIPAPEGTPIAAAEAGKVILAEYYGGYGNTIIIDHGGGMSTLYGHIRPGGIKVSVGQVVSRGQTIAEVGTTGLSTGPHLHFSVLKNGDYVNPMNYLGR
ncbi:MAG: peptidoglycan DD-metalloendopeptidase family protein [Hydrogenibacillus schlegelii]|nr:peptidoglycan DD-metalloendopeptidase family protein [Hydrogenibacillus schlegelii]